MKFWDKESYTVNSYYPDLMDVRINKVLHFQGTDYGCNELGFRGDSIHLTGFKIMTVGCSHTQGWGVNDDETWPYYLAKMMNGLQYNISIGGSSNDTISRNIITYVDIIKPDVVLVLYTNKERFEYYYSGEIYPFSVNGWGFFQDTWVGKEIHSELIGTLSDDYNQVNWYKNHLLITYYLKNKSIPFFWNSGYIETDLQEENRFHFDYTKLADRSSDEYHGGVKHNYQFATEFYKFLKEKGY